MCMRSNTVPIKMGKNVSLVVMIYFFADQEQRVVHDTLFPQESGVSFDRAHYSIPVLLGEQEVQLEGITALVMLVNEVTLVVVLSFIHAGASFYLTVTFFELFAGFWL